MRARKVSMFFLGTIAVLSLSLCAQASPTYVQYNLSVPNGDLGSSSHTYTSSGYSLPIYGFETNVAPTWAAGHGTPPARHLQISSASSVPAIRVKPAWV